MALAACKIVVWSSTSLRVRISTRQYFAVYGPTFAQSAFFRTLYPVSAMHYDHSLAEPEAMLFFPRDGLVGAVKQRRAKQTRPRRSFHTTQEPPELASGLLHFCHCLM